MVQSAAPPPPSTPGEGGLRAASSVEALSMPSRRDHCEAVGPHGRFSRLRRASLFFFFFFPPLAQPCRLLQAHASPLKETGGKMASCCYSTMTLTEDGVASRFWPQNDANNCLLLGCMFFPPRLGRRLAGVQARL